MTDRKTKTEIVLDYLIGITFVVVIPVLLLIGVTQ